MTAETVQLAWVSWLEHHMGSEFQRDFPLGDRTTYRVGGRATGFLRLNGIEDLVRLHAALAELEERPRLLVLGRGSNLLVSDRGFDGLVLSLGGSFESLNIDGSSVRVGASMALPVAARQIGAAGLSGFEWAVGVPGSFGGAVAMNAGGHGSDMAASLKSVTVVDLGGSTAVEEWPTARLDLSYRHSAITSEIVVLGGELELAGGDSEQIKGAMSDVVQWRRAHQPGGQNAGSVFVNPTDHPPAAFLIEEAGLRGYRLGSATVSPKHANFIQAEPDGRAQDVFDLIFYVRETVREAFGVELTTEIRMIGFEEGEVDRGQ
ncbi:MAG: UDP-N-acetylmuramate dehydrogenase [Acidimicrobiales bacterium]